MRRALAAGLTVLFLFAAVPAVAQCVDCKYSANNFGNCRPADGDGYTHCSRYTEDTFSGRTDCYLTGTCVASGGGGDEPCWWTDLDGTCIYSY